MDIVYIDTPDELQQVAISGYTYTTEATFWTVDQTLKVSLKEYLDLEDGNVTELPYESLLIVGDSKTAKTKKQKEKLKTLRRVAKVVKHTIPAFWDDRGWINLVSKVAAFFEVSLPTSEMEAVAESKNVSDVITILGKIAALDTTESVTVDLIRSIRGFDYVDFGNQITKLVRGQVIAVPTPMAPFLYYSSKRVDSYLRVRLGCFEGNRYQVKYLRQETDGVSTDRLRFLAKQLSLAVGRVEVSGLPSANFFYSLVDTPSDYR